MSQFEVTTYRWIAGAVRGEHRANRAKPPVDHRYRADAAQRYDWREIRDFVAGRGAPRPRGRDANLTPRADWGYAPRDHYGRRPAMPSTNNPLTDAELESQVQFDQTYHELMSEAPLWAILAAVEAGLGDVIKSIEEGNLEDAGGQAAAELELLRTYGTPRARQLECRAP